MSNAIGIAVIVSNIAVVGIFAYAAYNLKGAVSRLEKRVDSIQQDTSDRLKTAIKGLL